MLHHVTRDVKGLNQLVKLLPSTLCLQLHSADDSNPFSKTQIELVFSTLFRHLGILYFYVAACETSLKVPVET